MRNAFVRVYMCMHVYARAHVWMCMCICVCVCVWRGGGMRVWMCSCACTCACTCVFTSLCACVPVPGISVFYKNFNQSCPSNLSTRVEHRFFLPSSDRGWKRELKIKCECECVPLIHSFVWIVSQSLCLIPCVSMPRFVLSMLLFVGQF